MEIRHATRADLEAIHAWLIQEKKAGADGNFLCNFDFIANGQRNRRLVVLCEAGDKTPVAFCLMTSAELSILAVRADRRGQGFGTVLARHCMEKLRKAGVPGLVGECQPLTSVPFWKKMGFAPVYSEHPEYKMAIRFPRTARLPKNKPSHFIRIGLFDLSAKTPLVHPFIGRAAYFDAHEALLYRLEEEYVEYMPLREILVRVEVDGSLHFEWFLPDAEPVGFKVGSDWIRARELRIPISAPPSPSSRQVRRR
jgi:predicted N-acetyltransferase YhbS